MTSSDGSVDDAQRQLVQRAAAHDPDAWESLYRSAYRNLFGFARRRLCDDQAADDAVSETMARALDRIDGFTWRDGGFNAWLFGIARNVVHEHGRARQRSVPIDVEPTSTARGPEDDAMYAAEVDALRVAFAKLTPDEQELLELRVTAGLSSDEVGRMTGRKPVAVRMAHSRALGRLRTFMEEVHRAD